MGEASIEISIDDETLGRLDRIATALGCDRRQAIERLVERAAHDGADFIDFVQVGIDDLEAGRSAPHEEVFTRLRARRQARQAA